MSRLGKRLINAAKSAQAIAKGEADPKTYRDQTVADEPQVIQTECSMFGSNFIVV